MSRAKLLVYGDHFGNKISDIRKAYRISRTRPIIKDFLNRATDLTKALAVEIHPSERERLGDFTDLHHLAAHFDTSPCPSEAAGFALTIIAQVAELLR